MLSVRNSLAFCAATLGMVGIAGCWVGSTPSGSPGSFGGFTSTTAGASAGGAPSSAAGAPGAGAPAAVGGDMSGAGAPAATGGGGDTSALGGGGASSAGAPAGGAATGGSGGAAAGGAPAGGAPAGGSGGAASCPAPTGLHQPTALDRSCWNAVASDCAMTTANMNPPQMALDASLTTRFSTGVTMLLETAPFTYQIDMTNAVMITGVSVNSSNATDWAPMLEVDVSTDAQTWTPVACGSGATLTDLSFAAVSARYVRLTQMGSAATGGGSGWWSIYDLNVYGSMGTEMACPTPGPGATGSCTTQHTT